MAFRYPCDRSVTWPGDAGLPSFAARRHSWGFNSRCRAPFAGLIPLTGGCVSRRRAAHARRGRPVPGFFAGPFSFVGIRRFRRSGPTCRLPPLVHAPIDFRRRDRPLVKKREICKSDRPGTFLNGGSTSGLQLPSAVRRRDHAASSTILPWALPLAGLSVTRGVSRLFHACNRPGSTPVPDQQPPGRPRAAPACAAAVTSLSARGFSTVASASVSPGEMRRRSLQRVDGAAACST